MYTQIISELETLARPVEVDFIQHFFRAIPGGYGEGDVFIAVRVPKMRALSKKYYKLISLEDLQKLIASLVHEHRLTALFMLILKYEKSKVELEKQELVEFYIQNLDRVNNWDLVDTSAHKILGPYFFDQIKSSLPSSSHEPSLAVNFSGFLVKENINPPTYELSFLYELANSDKLWHQRIAIITTFYFIKRDHFEHTLQISKILLNHPHDLIHKAVGWMLREVGNRAMEVEVEFLNKYYKQMPRTMLRYAIEKFVEIKRQTYLKGLV